MMPMPTPEEREREEVARRLSWLEPARPPPRGDVVLPALLLLPRFCHVQPSADGRHPLGRVPWEEHAEACERLGKDPEREARRGGLSWDDLCCGLVREPRGWEAW